MWAGSKSVDWVLKSVGLKKCKKYGLARLKRDRLTGAFDRLSCSKRGREEWKSIFANQDIRIQP